MARGILVAASTISPNLIGRSQILIIYNSSLESKTDPLKSPFPQYRD